VAEPPVMDLHDADATVKYLIRDRDGRYTTAFDTVFEDDSIAVVKTGIRYPAHERDHGTLGALMPS
jgi:hypothetical protein